MAEFSVYPDAIDGYSQLPLVVDSVTRVDAVTVNRLREAIVNIETELGILPSSDRYDTVRERLDALEDSEALGYKNPARVATTGNVTLDGSAPLSVDGVNVVNGDRVLVYQQTAQSENGIYEVQTAGTGANGTWVRSSDSDTAGKLIPGSEIYIVEGAQATCKFWLITPGPITLGVTALEFVGGLSIMRTDSAPTTILAATSIGATEATATPTASLSVRSFSEIDISFSVTNLDAITELRIRVLYSLLETPGTYGASPEDWNILLSEDITGGVASVDAYTVSLNTTTYPDFAALPGSFAIRAPVSGLHMMALIWSETGASAASSFTGIALRRV